MVIMYLIQEMLFQINRTNADANDSIDIDLQLYFVLPFWFLGRISTPGEVMICLALDSFDS